MVTDKMQDILGGMFTRTELSEVLTEIVKMDPNFCKEQFLKDCERDIIPNVLEAMIRGDLEILKDWLVHTLKLLTNENLFVKFDVGKKYFNFLI
jgi:hypothetical protein